jgi:hypothetical protein
MKNIKIDKFLEVKICRYRNCNKEIDIDKRIDAQFCNKKCKNCERIYRKRLKIKEGSNNI